jgi:glycosyltransferase involved in cell wall biosynthesis
MPRLSVIIPLFNKRAYVQRALESIAAQTLDDFEVIVVNDGSTDGSDEIVKQFPDQRLRLINQPNAGPGAARNRGIAEARGELLAFLDADDEWTADYLQASVRALDDAPQAAAVTSGYVECPAETSREPLWRSRGLRDGLFMVEPETPVDLLVQALAFMSPCTTVARAKVVRQHGGYFARERCTYAEDAWLWLKVLLNHSVVFQLRPLVRLHLDASELSRRSLGARPIEPFLKAPAEVIEACPLPLQGLLQQFLSTRAFKTASMLGYWGKWREARALRSRFLNKQSWRLPYYVPAMVCSTPLGAGLGRAHRSLSRCF